MLNMYCTGYGAHELLEFGLIGTEGWLVGHMRRDGDELEIGRRGEEQVKTVLTPEDKWVRAFSHSGAVYREHEAFLASRAADETPLTGLREGFRATFMALEAERSIAEGRTVDICFGDGDIS